MEERILALNALALGLAETRNLMEALETCLDITLRTSGMTDGAAYAMSRKTGHLQVVCSKGSSQGFSREVVIGNADTEAVRKIMQGKLICGRAEDMGELAALLHAQHGRILARRHSDSIRR